MERQERLELEEATRLTNALRTSNHRPWVELRERVEAEGLDLEDVAVGTLFPDDARLLFGIIGTRDGRAFSFDFEFERGASLSEFPPVDSYVWSWTELVSDEGEQPYGQYRDVADKVLRG